MPNPDFVDLPAWLLDALEAAVPAGTPEPEKPLAELRALGEVRRAMPQLVEHVGMRARLAGGSWPELAEALGLATAGSAQVAIDPDIRRRREEQSKKRDRVSEITAPREPAPGIGPTEAARRLGVTPRTVYTRIERGELTAVEHRGRTRIIGGDPALGLDDPEQGEAPA